MQLKEKIKRKELTIGSWITFSDPAVAEIMSNMGFDWLAVDMEHGGLSIDQAQQIIRTIELKNITPLVRVMENNADLIKRFMDAGAHGVIVPLVNTKEEARKAVNAVKYPPIGTRGVGLSRAQNYSMDFEKYRKWNQEESVVIVQVEHIKAVENLDAIMSVDGVDGFIIGLYDLSGSIGHPGEFQHPELVAALDEIYRISDEKGYLIGQHVVKPDPKLVIEKVNRGVKFIGFGVDFLFFSEIIRNSMESLKSITGDRGE